MSTNRRTINQFLNEPVDSLWLALYRIALGLCLLWQVWKYFSADLIRNFYVEPTIHFTWLLFDFVRPWPEPWMYFHFTVLGIAASCIAVGFHYRLAAFVFWLGYSWVFLIDQCWYLNHYYLICLLSFLAIFLPANCDLSIDAWRNPRICSRTVPSWTLWLMRFQVAIPYFYGGIAKINADWFAGEPMRTWLAERTDFPVIGQYFTQEWCVMAFCWGGLLLDVFVVPLLLWKRTRVPVMLTAICFHLMNWQLFQIGVFPWMMICLTLLLFIPPSTTARLRVWHRASDGDDINAAKYRLRRPLAAFLAVYVCWQILMPLRHHLYGTHAAFTREGHQFAWRMKLNERRVDAQFSYVDRQSGDTGTLPLHEWITWHQSRKLHDADQLLQLAHHMREKLKEQHIDAEIHADVSVSLNGRDPSPYVSEELDLTTIERTLTPGDWFTTQPTQQYLTRRASHHE